MFRFDVLDEIIQTQINVMLLTCRKTTSEWRCIKRHVNIFPPVDTHDVFTDTAQRTVPQTARDRTNKVEARHTALPFLQVNLLEYLKWK